MLVKIAPPSELQTKNGIERTGSITRESRTADEANNPPDHSISATQNRHFENETACDNGPSAVFDNPAGGEVHDSADQAKHLRCDQLDAPGGACTGVK